MATKNPRQLEAKDNGSNYNFSEKMQDANVPRSMFDLSHLNAWSVKKMGTIYPIALIPTLPRDSHDITLSSLFRAMPSVVPMQAGQHIYTYAFWSRMGDLWNKWDTFAKKGYSGNVNYEIPKQSTSNVGHIDNGAVSTDGQELLPCSMGEMLGLPMSFEKTTSELGVTTYNNIRKDTDFNGIASILPEMMLLRIWRDYFTNKDYWINDRVILPDDDNDFRLDNDGVLISAKNENVGFYFDIGSNTDGIQTVESQGNITDYVFGLPIHEYPKDRFTSAKPFLQRGDAPTLNMTIESDSFIPITLKSNENIEIGTVGAGSTIAAGGTYTNTNGYQMINTGSSTAVIPTTRMGINTSTMNIDIGITLNDIRNLAIAQAELERMAQTDGSYAEFGLTFFGIASKNATDHKPVYIGGSHKKINYTEVLQTSETNSSPLGSYAGHATEGDSNYLGHIDCDDYGYIMILQCIMPEVQYSNGLAKHWTVSTQDEIYLTGREKLGMTAIFNKEVNFNADDSDDEPFAYQTPWDEFRYLPNEIHGQIANMESEEFRPYTQSRIFEAGDVPNWSREFAEANDSNVRTDYLATSAMGIGTMQNYFDWRAVRPLPYIGIPANIL